MDLISSWVNTFSDFVGLQAWALTVFLIILLALLIDFIQRRLMNRLADLVEATENLWDDGVFHAAVRPLSILIWLIGITLAAQIIPDRGGDGLLSAPMLTVIRQLGVLLSFTWFLVALVKNIEVNAIEMADRDGRDSQCAGPCGPDHHCCYRGPHRPGYSRIQYFRPAGRRRYRWVGDWFGRERHVGQFLRWGDCIYRPAVFSGRLDSAAATGHRRNRGEYRLAANDHSQVRQAAGICAQCDIHHCLRRESVAHDSSPDQRDNRTASR